MTGALASASILVVDDDEQVREVTAELVRQLGYEVTTARSGAEALNILEERGEFKVMLSDIRMPGIDGEQLAELAHELRPDLRIVLTSGGNFSRHDLPFLPKPYRMNDLMLVLSRAPASAQWTHHR